MCPSPHNALHPQNVPQNSRHLTPRQGGSSLPQETADLTSIYTWPTVVPDLELHKRGFGPPVLLCVWLLAFWMMIVRFSPMVACVSGSFLFTAEWDTLTSVWVLPFFTVPWDVWGQYVTCHFSKQRLLRPSCPRPLQPPQLCTLRWFRMEIKRILALDS